MTVDTVPPKFLSLEFHTRFFPRLLLDRLRRRKKEAEGTSFTSSMEMIITLAVCFILIIIGLPSALSGGSIVGWVLCALGVGGLIFLTIASVKDQWGSRPRYDDFLCGFFFFLVSLGLLSGIPVGMEAHSAGLGILASLAGLVAGYLLGILTGLRMQHLGWIATILNLLAGFGAIVAAGTCLILLAALAWS